MSSLVIFAIGVFVTALCALFFYTTVHELRKASEEHDRFLGKGFELARSGAAAALDIHELEVEHREAEDEHTAWLDEVARWRRENRRALRLLHRIEAGIHDRDTAIEAHVQTILEHRDQERRHAQHLAEEKRSGSDSEHGPWVDSHQKLEEKHAEERAAHLRFAEDHRHLLAGLEELTETTARI